MNSYTSGTSDSPLLGDTIGENLDRALVSFAGREALVDCPSGRRWTYAELGRAVDEVARGLLAMGVAKGDRVGIWAPNCPEWVLVQYATARIGAIMVNINPAYRVHELEYVINQSGISVLVSYQVHKSSNYRELVGRVRAKCPQLEAVVYIDDPSWDRLVAAGAGLPASALAEQAEMLSCDDPINIQYTSGTTGFPKGATLSHHNILNNGYFVGELLRLHRARPGVPAGALLPLFRHGHGQPRRDKSRRLHRDPRAVVRPGGHPCGGRRLSTPPRFTACPRCSSPSLACPTSPATTCPACAPGSWRARPARSRS